VSLLQIISHSLIIILDQTCIDNNLLLNILLGFRLLALPTMFQEQRFCSIIVKILVLKRANLYYRCMIQCIICCEMEFCKRDSTCFNFYSCFPLHHSIIYSSLQAAIHFPSLC
jgi:hypothetical protein